MTKQVDSSDITSHKMYTNLYNYLQVQNTHACFAIFRPTPVATGDDQADQLTCIWPLVSTVARSGEHECKTNVKLWRLVNTGNILDK